jgi:hypothetical protein
VSARRWRWWHWALYYAAWVAAFPVLLKGWSLYVQWVWGMP